VKIEFTCSGIYIIGQPAAVGVSTSRSEVLRIYQTKTHRWDLYYVSELSNIRVTNDMFPNDPPGYKKGDDGMSLIYEEL
jgi:hypothetical protein